MQTDSVSVHWHNSASEQKAVIQLKCPQSKRAFSSKETARQEEMQEIPSLGKTAINFRRILITLLLN